ncbi:four-carbon acid sugar kinase family protein [Paenibacillus lautus]|uniref:four-carbon acid sugar kinase family protein n=1 Tax=Paenibacillus lautus TaxID=1401 RepID=UPI000FD8D528|nr:four-carbon acid sugar kinase family protein [Paenibacillus lautus]
MNELAIIADDLTGATDSGVQFARRGFNTQVVLHAEEVSAIERNSEIIVLDTDSRAVAAGEAYERTRLAALQVARMGFKHVYKKLDSTLRGNLGAEIDAVADAIPVDCIIVAPAYPKIGRTTRNGIHYVNDVRIDRTETAKDPKSPVAEADLVKLLASQSQRQAGLLPLEALRAGAEAASLRIGKLLRSGIEIIVCDAVSDEDLRRIADVAAAGVGRMLWAGSAGLAECLPDSLALARGRGAHEHLSRVVPERGKPVLLVAGSISKITRSQVAAFNQCPRTKAVELDAIAAMTSDEGCDRELERCSSAVRTALAAGFDVSLYAGCSPGQVRSAQVAGAARGLQAAEVSNRIASLLGLAASECMDTTELQGVILTGGDTAKAVCRHLNASGIRLVREIEPGIPLGRLVGSIPLNVVTKAGAFGRENSLVHAKVVLKGEPVDE